jgi:hypothetical protein
MESSEPRRNTAVGVMALVVTLILLVVTVLLVLAGGWWLLLAVPVVFTGAACAYGVRESFQVVPRDAKGRRLVQ